jgi:ribosomal protein L11 methyltransferase
MERLAHAGEMPKQILDLGCGTGILSIAAAKLWPSAVILAIDNDEVAVEVCRENIKRNNLLSRIHVEKRSANEVQGVYDLILANLSAPLLFDLHPQLRDHLKEFSILVLSGITTEHVKSLAATYCKDLIFELEFSEEKDGWWALLLKTRE